MIRLRIANCGLRIADWGLNSQMKNKSTIHNPQSAIGFLLTACAILASAAPLAITPQGRAQLAALEPERTSLLDNSTLAVTRLHFLPGSRETVHTHPFSLGIVQLTAGNITVSDGETFRVGNRPGEVWFISANTSHAVSNRSGSSIDMLAIAIKPDRAPAPSAPPADAPAGIVRMTLVDNAEVRIVRVRFAPNGREPVHAHPNDLLTVQITSGKVEILEGGRRSTAEQQPGDIHFLPRNVEHSFASSDTRPFEILSVSIK
jgi:quercetin dioxygenase-like cupin family protein